MLIMGAQYWAWLDATYKTSHEARYKELLAAAAAQLDRAESDAACERLALLKLQREAIAVRIINGENLDSTELLRLDAAIAEATPEPASQHTVQIQLVKRIKGICPVCKAEVPDYTPPISSPPCAIDAKANPVPEAKAEPKAESQDVTAANAAARTEVAGSIHEGRYACLKEKNWSRYSTD